MLWWLYSRERDKLGQRYDDGRGEALPQGITDNKKEKRLAVPCNKVIGLLVTHLSAPGVIWFSKTNCGPVLLRLSARLWPRSVGLTSQKQLCVGLSRTAQSSLWLYVTYLAETKFHDKSIWQRSNLAKVDLGTFEFSSFWAIPDEERCALIKSFESLTSCKGN